MPLLQQREGEIQMSAGGGMVGEHGKGDTGGVRGGSGFNSVVRRERVRLQITHRILFFNQDLRRQLHDAETQAWENGQAKDRELQASTEPNITAYIVLHLQHLLLFCACVYVWVQDLGRRLRDAESLAQQAQPNLAAKDREIQVAHQTWRCLFYMHMLYT